jgi:hypothetical protein
VPLAWGGDPVVLRAMCVPCHDRKTKEEAVIGRRWGGAPPADVINAHLARWGMRK